MAKGVPLMGRDPDGKAKIINVDENGNVKVQLSGTFVAVPLVTSSIVISPSSTIYLDDIKNGDCKEVALGVKVSTAAAANSLEVILEFRQGYATGWGAGRVLSSKNVSVVRLPSHSTLRTETFHDVRGPERRWALKNPLDTNMTISYVTEDRR